MNRIYWIALLFSFNSLAQSFAPAPDVQGTTAIFKDSSIIVNWANGVTVQRGPMDIAIPSNGQVSYGMDYYALGYADDYPVSLGDGGVAVVTFPYFIENGSGPDFAVFENGFIDNYMELAFVEVSSDGINFYRFESICEIPTDTQLSNTSTSDCRYVHNLAGKYRVNYGTPFDLEELNGLPGLDINMISHVRIVDVVGSIDSLYASLDSQNNIINDPYPTPFESGGFDLDAVAVIHQSIYGGLDENKLEIKVFPNPVQSTLFIDMPDNQIESILITDMNGRQFFRSKSIINSKIDISLLSKGTYLIHVNTSEGTFIQRFIKE